MQKRAALARALVTDPEIVLFDEPTTGQDPIRKNVILSMIAEYRKRFGFTAVMISHEIPDVFFISDRILLLWEGAIAFEGTYEELTQIGHPLIDEFLKSLEGFQDELTGLLSKQMFRSRYSTMLRHDRTETQISAVLFGIEFDQLAEQIGPLVAVEVLKALGALVNTRFGSLGGFSARHSRGQILTILPLMGLEETKEAVAAFARELEEETLCGIESFAKASLSRDVCLDVHVYAGISHGNSNDDIDYLTVRAKIDQKVIASYRCYPTGGEA
jgi:phospholipid/cholesterol/gamma-HCH transport system ATP-binding protein